MGIQSLELAQATTIALQYCDSCGYPHMILKDEKGEAFAEAVISEIIAEALVADLVQFLRKCKEADDGVRH